MNDPNGFSFHQGKFHLFFSTISIPPNGAHALGARGQRGYAPLGVPPRGTGAGSGL